ncbi:hypothetical protein PIB30_034776 [Stylosanthes scabra]|uniref:Uncharacterized protein n=1 Tax=Stylosanthes scabra TaxID=79078 RepID=A0ABU6RD05_9FABA|nr:hypothetical protein [Stylosanthes scabra]
MCPSAPLPPRPASSSSSSISSVSSGSFHRERKRSPRTPLPPPAPMPVPGPVHHVLRTPRVEKSMRKAKKNIGSKNGLENACKSGDFTKKEECEAEKWSYSHRIGANLDSLEI